MNLFDVLFAKKLSGGGSPFPPVIKRVTGNPIEFTDGADAPLVKCVTEIQGYQEGSGTPSPENVRPIVAYTEGKIEVMGRNLANWTMTSYADASPTELKKGTYTCSIDMPMVDQNWYISAKKSDNTYCTKEELGLTDFLASATTGVYYGARSLAAFTFTIPEDDVTVKIGSPGGHGQKIMLERGSVEHDYEPYTSTTHTTTYPSAIYRGSEDCAKGTVECERKKITISSGIELYGNYGSENAPLFYWDSSVTDIAPYASSRYPLNNRPISNFYNAVSTPSDDMLDFEFRTRTETDTNPTYRFYFRDSRFTTAADFNAYIANNPIEIAYRVIPSTTSSVTPTNLPIKSLSGYNHIESSAGDMEIDYITDAYQNFVDTVENALPNTTRNLLTASKGGVKAFDIFKTLDEPKKPEASAEESEPEEKETEEGAKR